MRTDRALAFLPGSLIARLGAAGTQFGGVAFTTLYQPEHDMKTSRMWFLRTLSCGLSLAALTLAFVFDGSRAVRAEDAEVLPPSLQEMIGGPIMKTVQGFEQRIASIEATVADFADSFTSRRIAAQLLCVSDQSGAQTCITKSQLDSLLGKLAQAEVVQPHPPVTVTEAVAPPAELAKITTATDPTPAAEPANVQAENPLPDQESEHTGAARSASSGTAVVSDPEEEISVAVPAPPSDE